MRWYLPVFLETRNYGFRHDPKLRSNALQCILSFIILTTSCSKTFSTLKLLACHGVCETVGMTCGGSTSSEKQPFSVKSKAMPALWLNNTSRKTSCSSALKSLPTLSLFIRSSVSREPRSISENFGIIHHT